MEVGMVPIPARNKPCAMLFGLFLVQLTVGNAVLYSRGKTDAEIRISTSGLCDFDFTLNERVAPEVLDRLSYADSINAYYYWTEDNDELFNKAYLWFKGGKRGRIKRISLSSAVDLKDIRSKDSYRAEYAAQVMYSRYGNLGLPNISKSAYKEELYTTGEDYYMERVYIEWHVKNVEIQYSYIPYYNFAGKDLSIIKDGKYSYNLVITTLKGAPGN
jgi:hypothetical protein